MNVRYPFNMKYSNTECKIFWAEVYFTHKR